jgi:parallel beta-helix repeat protein
MFRRTSATIVALTSLAVAGLIGYSAWAGPLNPPAGPVTSTNKTLAEVEPRIAINAANTPGDADSLYKITLPGSYYLTENITGVSGKHGIEITASGVTLDLHGFDLAGVPAMGAFDGVSITVAGMTNIAVVNGSIRNWGGDGVDLGTIAASNCRVEDVLASGNAGIGIGIGLSGSVSKCSAWSNGFGIAALFGCSISNCEAYQNTGTGISTFTGCTVTGCVALVNLGSGIIVSSGSTVADCTSRQNTLDGIVCSNACVVRANNCSTNGAATGDGAGIHATGSRNRIEGNTCTTADRGIDVDSAGNIIIRNTCSGNTNNWNVVAGNAILVVDATNLPTAAVTGNSGGANPGSDNPYANFSY